MGIRLKHHGKVVATCSIAKYIHQYMGTIENLKYQNLYNPKNWKTKGYHHYQNLELPWQPKTAK
jgi:hypothetical protein